MLELPITLRVPTPDEMPDRPDIDEILEKRREANIRPGYTLQPNHTPQLPYKFYAEINVDNSRLWHLFLALAAMFPASASAVYNEAAQDTLTTNLQPTSYILQHFSKYQTELTKDCALEFGLLSNTREQLTELAVSSCKYIKFWGNEQPAFTALMKVHNLPLFRHLDFVDEFPKIILPLRQLIPGTTPPAQVVDHFDRAFKVERENFY
ncbi:hypothetical protein GA0116948_102177 [Chitinophaga costaii]|uniref:Uncharacterized protein n=1 Tax=Chitinophaga costaii TaxID=1335309 RepID=A0A1C4AKL1_9BACT|nr:hypothetical protein [Chitinophaga costaii]PUZ26645.1 hypothetical protein DCM91_09565 [Chitinophaga costaii]SCB95165.1 hypothetical protein GA0116948_102177 [Chitinophaga costaii]